MMQEMYIPFQSLEILCQFKDKEFKCALNELNKHKNRYSNKVPSKQHTIPQWPEIITFVTSGDSKRVCIYQECEYINASFVNVSLECLTTSTLYLFCH